MKNLSEFISLLESSGELVRVSEFVSVNKEIAEINDRIVKSGGKAILFENNETKFPVLVNMFGTPERIALALRVSNLSDLTDSIDSIFKTITSPMPTLSDKLKMIPLAKNISQWMPRNKSKKGECQQVILQGGDVKLSELPILLSAPFDAGSFVTLPLVNTIDPETNSRNVGMYRMQVMSENTTGMHWHKHKTGEQHYQKYKKLGKRMPVAVCIGGDPAYTYSATAPLPPGIDEYILSGFIRNSPVKLVKCITNDIRVPDDCDFVIEGYIDPQEEKVVEGPFGDHTGFYSLEGYYPVFHVTCITHRKDAVYPATVVGVPPQEDAFIGLATERIFLSPIKAVMLPEIQDMHLPFDGVAHNLVIFSIEKSYAGQGLKVASAMWGAGQMMFNKLSIITSLGFGEICNYSLLKEELRKIDIRQAVMTTLGPLDVLDHNSSVCGFGGKMCFDLTTRMDGESIIEPEDIYYPNDIELTDGVEKVGVSLAKNGWSVLVFGVSRGAGDTKEVKKKIDFILSTNKIKGINLVVMFDPEHDLEDVRTLLWVGGNNIDPVRDSVVSDEYILLDARSKFSGINGFTRPWPNVVTQDAKVIEAIDEKWDKLGLGEFIESPSKRYMHLKFEGGSSVSKKD